ncbi:MAG: thiamine-phosphate kinase [Kangiellaceae bacterium]|nr:thiamine-phosphate kinase [Kangiellaceae bacterium]
MAEFEVIDKYFNFGHSGFNTSKRVIKSIGDDCAILDVPKKSKLVTSTDTLIEGVHFFSDVAAADLAYKALAVNVSDLAAMGAKPLAFTLAITLPETDSSWLSEFSRSLKQASKQFDIPLVGGDTTQGYNAQSGISITISVFGTVKKEKVLLRDTAKQDQDIWITGYLGNAAAALALHGKERLNEQQKYLWQQLVKPSINHKFSRKLTKYCQCAIDVSDGLLADLGHIIVQSKVGAKVNVEALPLSDALIDEVGIEEARQYALTGGDDYQLCFVADRKWRNSIHNLAERYDVSVSRIGKIVEQGMHIILEDKPLAITKNSWQHFKKQSCY